MASRRTFPLETRETWDVFILDLCPISMDLHQVTVCMRMANFIQVMLTRPISNTLMLTRLTRNPATLTRLTSNPAILTRLTRKCHILETRIMILDHMVNQGAISPPLAKCLILMKVMHVMHHPILLDLRLINMDIRTNQEPISPLLVKCLGIMNIRRSIRRIFPPVIHHRPFPLGNSRVIIVAFRIRRVQDIRLVQLHRPMHGELQEGQLVHAYEIAHSTKTVTKMISSIKQFQEGKPDKYSGEGQPLSRISNFQELIEVLEMVSSDFPMLAPGLRCHTDENYSRKLADICQLFMYHAIYHLTKRDSSASNLLKSTSVNGITTWGV